MAVTRKLPPLPRHNAPFADIRTGNAAPDFHRTLSELWTTLEEMRVQAALTYTDMGEMTAPAAPAANTARIFVQDNGAGKTQLMVIFPTGAAQQIAIEP
jgi:hypothetical protein